MSEFLSSARTPSLSVKSRMADVRSLLAIFYNLHKRPENRVIMIGSIKSVVLIRTTRNKLKRAELTKLVLNRAKRKSAKPHQLTNVAFFPRRQEKET